MNKTGTKSKLTNRMINGTMRGINRTTNNNEAIIISNVFDTDVLDLPTTFSSIKKLVRFIYAIQLSNHPCFVSKVQ